MGSIPGHTDKVWVAGGHEESTLAAIYIAYFAINPLTFHAYLCCHMVR